MRVLLIAESYPPEVGGVASSAARLARGLARRLGSGAAHVLCPGAETPPGAVETSEEEGVAVHRFGPPDRADWRLQMMGNALTALHEQERFDVLHGFYLTPPGYLAAFYARLFGVRSCVSARGNDVDRDMFSANRLPFIRYALERADVVTCVSRELQAKAAALCGRDNIRIVPNGVDASVFQPTEEAAQVRRELGFGEEPVVGFVGELRFKKGLPFLLDAFAALDAPARLLLVGPIRRGAKDYLADFADARPGVKTRIRVVEPVSDPPRLAALYGVMDVVLCPSLWDGMPNSVLEAMACGRVVLASDAGGIRDVIRSGETGFLVSRHELHRLGEALREVLALSPSERREIGARARRRVQDAHDPEQERAAYEDIYKELSGLDVEPR